MSIGANRTEVYNLTKLFILEHFVNSLATRHGFAQMCQNTGAFS